MYLYTTIISLPCTRQQTTACRPLITISTASAFDFDAYWPASSATAREVGSLRPTAASRAPASIETASRFGPRLGIGKRVAGN